VSEFCVRVKGCVKRIVRGRGKSRRRRRRRQDKRERNERGGTKKRE
jgi:hypothetical protein